MFELKVKIKSLASESKIIHQEKSKAMKSLREAVKKGISPLEEPRVRLEHKISSLNHHRKDVVGKEARVSQLAYAFLRGVPYKSVEPKCKESPNWDRVWWIAMRFVRFFKVDKEKFIVWKNSGDSGSNPDEAAFSAKDLIQVAEMLLITHGEEDPEKLDIWVTMAIDCLERASILLKNEQSTENTGGEESGVIAEPDLEIKKQSEENI